MDTEEWVHREIVRRLRLMTPADRLQVVLARVEMGREIHRIALKRMAESRANYRHD